MLITEQLTKDGEKSVRKGFVSVARCLKLKASIGTPLERGSDTGKYVNS